MAMDTPATIAILGAGPIGIETGLYARYLGYQVVIFECCEVAANVLSWGHLPMLSPFSDLHSPLGIAALSAQDSSFELPRDDTQLTGRQWVERYVKPLSDTDLLADQIVCGTTVVRIGRRHETKMRRDTNRVCEENGFRILLERNDGTQAMETADIIVDTTGVHGQPNWCGAGGIPACGEQQWQSRIVYTVPDLTGAERGEYEAKHTLVVGNGLSAATTVVALAAIGTQFPQTRVTWVTSRVEDDGQAGPIQLAPFTDDAPRRQLAESANRCALDGPGGVAHLPGALIEGIDYDAAEDRFLVRFAQQDTPQCFDRIIANVGYRGDMMLLEELQVRQSLRTGGPWGVAQWLDSDLEERRNMPRADRAATLLTTEPHFYVLGAKSYGRDSRFQMARGYEQIRDLFSIIGDRAELDLYATTRK